MRKSSRNYFGRSSASSTERTRCSLDPTILGARSVGRQSISQWSHFAFVPNGFLSRTKLGYGADWPIDWRDMWRYYAEVENALKIAGPVSYPWGPQRPRYPNRAHELNAAANVLVRGAEAMGIAWAPTPLATLSAPRGSSPPCVYRGFCTSGCSTNAKQSALVTWIPRAVRAGAEIRDLATVGLRGNERRSSDRRALFSRRALALPEGA